MVAKRKATKDERELPPAARDNPYATYSREELDAALSEIDASLAALPEGAPELQALEQKKRLVFDGYLILAVRAGVITRVGAKPRLPKKRIKLAEGVSMSQWILENRR